MGYTGNLPVDATQFWDEARPRRNLFFLVWVLWLVVGPILWWLYSLVISAQDPMVAGTAALFTWGAFWWWTAWRVTQLKCPRCGKRALSSPYFFMSHACCKNCGLTYVGT